jgi:hypothetical protein
MKNTPEQQQYSSCEITLAKLEQETGKKFITRETFEKMTAAGLEYHRQL